MRAEIARGGMGAIYHAFDRQLGREVAIKVVIPGGRTDVRLRRFVKEAQITGQLQHPGVPPVYELGRLPDMRPFIAMKYVGGDTLRTLLDRRLTPSRDLPRLLDVFEQLCQTVGFAHTKHRIVHRDLKPANVMVGKHGETQVMDWGIAKILDEAVGRLDVDEFEEPESNAANGVDVGSDWSNVDSAVTRAGAVLGTPAYMPPEQAQGEIGEVDERIDVFALGAILCEILTGKPPYDGPLIQQVLVMAQQADQAAARKRLEECDADRELVELSLSCLSPDKADRPLHAGEVAAAVTDYLRSTQQKLRQAEVDRAKSVVRITEERKRRRIQLALVGLLATIIAVLGSAWYALGVRHNVASDKVKTELRRATDHADLAEQEALDPAQNWAHTEEAIRAAEQAAAGDDGLFELIKSTKADVNARRQQSDKDLELLKELPALLGDYSVGLNKLNRESDAADRPDRGRPRGQGPPRRDGFPPPRNDRAAAVAGGARMDALRLKLALMIFAEYGFSVGHDVTEFANHLVDRPVEIQQRIVAALDVWYLLACHQPGADDQATWLADVLDQYESKTLAVADENTQDELLARADRRHQIRVAIQTDDGDALRQIVDVYTADQSFTRPINHCWPTSGHPYCGRSDAR
jgi:serine/threonine-protein kinase